jgi:hypothetical protein
MSWKIGYPSGLCSVASEAAGRALYQKYLDSITLSELEPLRSFGSISSVSSGISITLSEDETGDTLDSDFVNGFCRITNVAEDGLVHKITGAASSVISISGFTATTSDAAEAIIAGATYTFPSSNEPEFISMKTQMDGTTTRFNFNKGGMHNPYGRFADSCVLRVKLKTMDEVRKLMQLISNPVSYTGNLAIYSQEEAAPLVLQDDYGKQTLLHIEDGKYNVKADTGGLITVSITAEQYVRSLLRGY